MYLPKKGTNMGLSTRFYCLSDCSHPIMLKSGDEQAILGTSFCPNEIRGICTLLHNLSSARNLLRCGKIFVKPLLVAQNFRDENSTTMTSARTCDIRAYIYIIRVSWKLVHINLRTRNLAIAPILWGLWQDWQKHRPIWKTSAFLGPLSKRQREREDIKTSCAFSEAQ